MTVNDGFRACADVDPQSLRRLAARLIANEQELDDVVQEAWLRALRTPPRDEQTARAWFASVIKNLGRRLGRRSFLQQRATMEVAPRAPAPAAADVVEQATLKTRLVEAVGELSEPYRSVVEQRYFEGLTTVEIAHERGVPAATIRSQLKRALTRIRSKLDAEYGRREELALVLLAVSGKGSAPGGFLAGWRRVALAAAAAASIALPVFWSSAARSERGALEIAGRDAGAERRDDRVPRRSSPAEATPELPPRPPAEAPGPAPALSQLRGRIVRAGGGPIPGARVMSFAPAYDRLFATDKLDQFRRRFEERQPLHTTTAGSDGTFELAHTHRRACRLVVRAKGFGTKVVDVDLSDVTDPLRVEMRPSLTVRTKLVDEDHRPLDGAEVAIHSHDRSLTLFHLTPYVELKKTGPDGIFEFEASDGAPTIDQRIFLRAEGFAPRNLPAPRKPDGVDFKEYRITLFRGRSVDIHVARSDGAGPPPRVRLLVTIPSLIWADIVETDGRGRAKLEHVPIWNQVWVVVDSDEWVVDAEAWQPHIPGGPPGGIPFVLGSPDGDEHIEIPLTRGRSVSGIVLDRKTRLPIRGVELVGMPHRELISSLKQVRRTRSGPHGRFELPGLFEPAVTIGPASPEWIVSVVDGSAPERAIRSQDGAGWFECAVDREAPVADLVLLAERTARIEGRAIDEHGRAVAGARVRLDDGVDLARRRGLAAWGRISVEAVTGPDGSFTLESVAPGPRRRLTCEADAGAVRGEGAIDLAPGEDRAGVVLRLERHVPAALSVSVVDPQGMPRAAVIVRAEHVGSGTNQLAVTGEGGEARFPSLRAGPTLVRPFVREEDVAIPRGYSDAVDLAPGRTTTLEVRLVEAGLIAGRVIDERHQGFKRAQVTLVPVDLTSAEQRRLEQLETGSIVPPVMALAGGRRLFHHPAIAPCICAKTDDRGCFRVAAPDRRDYRVLRVSRRRPYWDHDAARMADVAVEVLTDGTLSPGVENAAVVVRQRLPTRLTSRAELRR